MTYVFYEFSTLVVCPITGAERYTFTEVAKLAAKLWNKPIEYVPVSNEEMYKIFESLGIPKQGDPSQSITALIFGSDEIVQQFGAYDMGLLDIVSAHVELITGTKPARLEDTLKQMIAAEA